MVQVAPTVRPRTATGAVRMATVLGPTIEMTNSESSLRRIAASTWISIRSVSRGGG
jgi:hypothetical protein